MSRKFEYFDCLGARSYYTAVSSPSEQHAHISGAQLESRFIDPCAILGILMKNYALSNRTLVQGIERTPWMTQPDGSGGWLQAELPYHGNHKVEPKTIAFEMKNRLQAEALSFLEGKLKIGIMLSGGMDSRIVAGIVRQLQEDGRYSGEVVALTWGLTDSRDVVYAQRIAQHFGWEFQHFPLNSETLWQNIHIAADRGAEYSPVHLHAMDSVAKIEGIDGVLAGSYGDSIGRGEYSGKRVTALPHILDTHLNQFALLLHSAEKKALKKIKKDLESDRARFPDRSEMSYREIEMQAHYMRRQLNACMEIIDDRVPVYQMFSAPEIFGFMWSLDPICRTDENYENLLKILPGNLLRIPWARTGARFNQSGGGPEDTLSNQNNCYGKWLRNDLREFVLDEIGSGALQSLGIFNERSITMWCRFWPKSNRLKADRLDEKMAWLTSLSLFVKKYNIQGIEPSEDFSVFDAVSQAKAVIHTQIYQAALKVLR